MLGLGQRGVLDAGLPVALPPTLYALAGEAVFWALLALLAICALALHVRRNARVQKDL
jgi:apolipoprotein N-acyltransferase